MKTIERKAVVALLLLLLLLAYTVCTTQPLYSQDSPSIIFRSPAPQTQFHPPSTTIAVGFDYPLPDAPRPAYLIAVEGQLSGEHVGTLVRASDGRTLIFKPELPFLSGETVTVTLSNPSQEGSSLSPAVDRWTFQVSSPRPEDTASNEFPLPAATVSNPNERLSLESVTSYVTIPDDFPAISVTVPASGTAPGYLFLSNFTVDWSQGDMGQSRPYLLILDDRGEPVFYRRMAAGRPLLDFKVQPNGMLTFGRWGGDFFVMDDSYQIVDTIAAGNGYSTDIHDLQMLPNGNALLMIYDAQPVDMSQVVADGNPEAIVIGLVIQEVDPDKNVVFQWRSWDHIPITDSSQDLTTANVDYVHGNGLELDTDGTILLSSRNLDEITKISRQTGAIIWRLGGKQNQFNFVDDTLGSFYNQHDVRRLANGNITIFDNRDLSGATFSRAVEYRLDELDGQATLVWEYRGQDVSLAMGNAQRLSNGSTLIGWGSMYPTLSEVRADGSLALEMSLVPNPQPNTTNNSYRVFRFPWVGKPVEPPTLLARSDPDGTISLYYSWNGATDIAYYRIYAGAGLEEMDFFDVQVWQGFETRSLAQEDTCFYKVIPVKSDGQETVFSNAIMLDACVTHRHFLPMLNIYSNQ